MRYEYITSDEQLRALCQEATTATSIAFDTEFISEYSYRPELCLVQACVDGRLVIIDPLKVADLVPFWELLATPGHETIVHAGREELLFCLNAIGRRPAGLIDVQIAAGLVGFEYPAGYGTLVSKVLGRSPPKGETRTNWRLRPLSHRQLEYAASDAAYLRNLRDALVGQILALGRGEWLTLEMASWQDSLEASLANRSWRRLPGIGRLDGTALGIVRELWEWREHQAATSNRPPRQILRDDLIVELARRGSPDPGRIRAVRGMERRGYARVLPELSAAIARGISRPEVVSPRARPSETTTTSVLGQFVSTVLASICRKNMLAPALVANAADVRDLINYILEARPAVSPRSSEARGSDDNAPYASPSARAASSRSPPGGGTVRDPPLIAQGWRAQVVGRAIEDLLAGRLGVRIGNPQSEDPLELVPLKNEKM